MLRLLLRLLLRWLLLRGAALLYCRRRLHRAWHKLFRGGAEGAAASGAQPPRRRPPAAAWPSADALQRLRESPVRSLLRAAERRNRAGGAACRRRRRRQPRRSLPRRARRGACISRHAHGIGGVVWCPRKLQLLLHGLLLLLHMLLLHLLLLHLRQLQRLVRQRLRHCAIGPSSVGVSVKHDDGRLSWRQLPRWQVPLRNGHQHVARVRAAGQRHRRLLPRLLLLHGLLLLLLPFLLLYSKGLLLLVVLLL